MDTNITSMKKTEDPIVVEQLYDASLDEVWAAITERDQMIQWFFDNIPAFDPKVDFETKFNINNEGRDFPHLWIQSRYSVQSTKELRTTDECE